MAKEENSVLLIYEVVKESLVAQQAQKNSLETNASTLIAFAGGMFALLMGSREALLLLSRVSQVLILISISSFALSVVLSNVVTWIRRYRVDPDPEGLAENYLHLPLEETKLQLVSNLIGTWKSNKDLLERNANYLRLAFLCQAIAFVLLGVSLFLSVMGG